jgi:hypothetical protein
MMNGLSGISNIMDSQTLINILFGAISAAFGWIFRVVWEAVKEMQRDLRDIEKNLPHDYVLKKDYETDIHEIKFMLGKIFDRLEGKADK